MRETQRAKQAFEDYFNMGAGRSLRLLTEQYCSYKSADPRPPSRRIATIKTWSATHNWQERVREREFEIAEAQFDAIKKGAIEAGYAHYPKRVQDLVALAELLLEEIYEEDKRWVPDVKSIGGGAFAERVDIVRFNSPLIEQFRRTLEDIASEMGERVKKVSLTGRDGGPIVIDHGAAARDALFSRLLSAIAGEGEAEQVGVTN